MSRNEKILFDEVGLVPGQSFKKGQWRQISVHDDLSICGFFGDYRYLSNFWPAVVFLDGVQYSCVENAYQAAKFNMDQRTEFQDPDFSPYESIKIARKRVITTQNWDEAKVSVMYNLLVHKFDKNINPDLHSKLQSSKGKYLEETNWWGDNFWGVTKTPGQTGQGENKLGKMLMQIRKDTC